jgi:hypothetical protein
VVDEAEEVVDLVQSERAPTGGGHCRVRGRGPGHRHEQRRGQDDDLGADGAQCERHPLEAGTHVRHRVAGIDHGLAEGDEEVGDVGLRGRFGGRPAHVINRRWGR